MRRTIIRALAALSLALPLASAGPRAASAACAYLGPNCLEDRSGDGVSAAGQTFRLGDFATQTVTQSDYRSKARKLLRAAARAIPVGVMGTAPTITLGTVNANSTLTTGAGNSGAAQIGGQTDSMLSPRLAPLSGVWGANGYGNGYTPVHVNNGNVGGSSPGRVGGGAEQGAGVGFFFDGQQFDFCVDGTSTAAVRIAVTDLSTGVRQWAQAADIVPTATGRSYTLVNFGSRANRIVEVYFGKTQLLSVQGFNFIKTDKVYPYTAADDPKALFFGDSYVLGTNNDNIRSGYAYVAAETLGIKNPVLNGVGGTGSLNGTYNFTARIAAGDAASSLIGNMDLVFMQASLNDNSFATDAQEQAAVQANVQALMAAQPMAIIMVAGPQFSKNSQTPASRYAAVQAGVQAASIAGPPQAGVADPRVVYIDNSPYTGAAWQSGSGTTTATAGDGSNDNIGAADGTHLTAAGNYDYGRHVALTIITALRGMAP